MRLVQNHSRSQARLSTLTDSLQHLSGEKYNCRTRRSPRNSQHRRQNNRVLCQLVIFLTVFSTGYTKLNTAAMKSPLLFMAGLFIGFLVEKCVAFGWHRFRFSPCLMRKRVQKSQAVLALLDSFQELTFEW